MPKRQSTDAHVLWRKSKDKRTVRDQHWRGVTDPVGGDEIALERCVFQRFNAANSRWAGCTFLDCTFRDSFFLAARFADCRFIRCALDSCGMARADFDNCRFEQCGMTDCDLSEARVEVSDPAAIRLVRSVLTAARFSGHSFFELFFPQYVCDQVVERGKQATVYLARQTADERGVAIKVFDQAFPGSTTSARLRLIHDEIDNLARIRSPFLPRLLSWRPDAAVPYLVQERVDGKPLCEWIESGERFSGPLRRQLFQQSLTGLDSLHTAQAGSCLLHRDIAPKNIMVDVAGEQLAWKFIDLGLSKIIAGKSAAASMIAGTPLTMAPEVMEGRGDSTRSELFSLGVTLAWAVTGAHPYGDRLTKDERLQAIQAGPRLPGLEQPYRGILEDCLRYRSAERLAPRDALARLAN